MGQEDSATRAARDVVVVFSRLRRRLRAVSQAEDLTPSQASVLSRLATDGPTTASALAGAEHVRPQSMAATLAGLDERALLQRRPDPGDGRRQLITLTRAGQQWVAGRRQAKEEWLVRALQDRCTERERRLVIEAMAVLEDLSQS